MAPRSTPNRTAGARKASAPTTRTRATKAAPAPRKAKANGTNAPVTKAASTPALKRANGNGHGNGNGAAKATSPAPPAKRPNGNTQSQRRSAANDTSVNNTGLRKLGKGGLEALVIDHMAANAKVEFSPSELGNKLDRSSGAIANALAKYAEKGLVVQTSERPRRYRFKGARSARRTNGATKR